MPDDSLPIEHNTEIVENGLALLLGQYADSDKMKAWFSTYLEQLQDIENAMQEVLTLRALATAFGQQLDGLGAIIGQPRLGNTDARYRVLLAARIAINKSSGTINELIKIARLIHNDEAAAVVFTEYYPASAELFLNETLFEPAFFYQMLLDTARPAGVRLFFKYIAGDSDNAFTFSSESDPVALEPGNYTSQMSSDEGFGDWLFGEDYGTGGMFVGVLPAADDPDEVEHPEVYYFAPEFV